MKWSIAGAIAVSINIQEEATSANGVATFSFTTRPGLRFANSMQTVSFLLGFLVANTFCQFAGVIYPNGCQLTSMTWTLRIAVHSALLVSFPDHNPLESFMILVCNDVPNAKARDLCCKGIFVRRCGRCIDLMP